MLHANVAMLKPSEKSDVFHMMEETLPLHTDMFISPHLRVYLDDKDF